MLNILPKNIPRARPSRLQEITLQGWSGGWNAAQNDLSMDPRFFVRGRNVRLTADNALTVRYGNKMLTAFDSATTNDPYTAPSEGLGTKFVNLCYFNAKLILVTETGVIIAYDIATKVKTTIFSDAIAAALPGTPSGWSSGLTRANFTSFRDAMIVHNGVDKPVTISSTFVVTYLQDLATGSNANVPIGKFCCTVSNYHIVAGIPAAPTTIYISSSGAAGVFPGDPDPNDSISIDVGAYVSEGSDVIIGVVGFKTYLLVFFQTQVLPIQLGTYESAVHTPQFPDNIPKFGTLNHRTIATLPNDVQFADLFGLGSARRSLVSGMLDAKHISEYIEPAYRPAIGALTNAQREFQCFSVYDQLNYSVLIILPDGRVFVSVNNADLRFRGWTDYTEMQFQCACASVLGRVYTTNGLRVYQLGNGMYSGENYSADLINNYDAIWLVNKAYTAGQIVRDAADGSDTYTCLVSHTSRGAGTMQEDREDNPTYWELYEGEEIDWEVELPWLTGREINKIKRLSHTKISSKGNGAFNLKIYVDNLFKDVAGNIVYDPAIDIDFVGNDAGGFGMDSEGGYGGGRRSMDPRLYRTPAKFKHLKAILSGSSRRSLTITSITFLYGKGAFSR